MSPLTPRESEPTKDKILTIRVSSELKARLARAAKKLNRNMNEVARVLLQDGLEREGF